MVCQKNTGFVLRFKAGLEQGHFFRGGGRAAGDDGADFVIEKALGFNGKGDQFWIYSAAAAADDNGGCGVFYQRAMACRR